MSRLFSKLFDPNIMGRYNGWEGECLSDNRIYYFDGLTHRQAIISLNKILNYQSVLKDGLVSYKRSYIFYNQVLCFWHLIVKEN